MPGLLPLETPRLTLRHFRDVDVPAFFAYRNDPEVSRWQSWEGITLEAAARFARDFAAGGPAPRGAWFQIAVAERQRDTLVGDCALKLLAEDPGAAEVGFTFAREHQGKGLAFEALSRLTAHMFHGLGLERVVAVTDAENLRAWRLLERMGMRREAGGAAEFKGRMTTEYHYVLDRSHWRPPDAGLTPNPG